MHVCSNAIIKVFGCLVVHDDNPYTSPDCAHVLCLSMDAL